MFWVYCFFIFIASVVLGVILLIVWGIWVAVAEQQTYNYLIENKDYLMNTYFKDVSTGANRFYTSGFFTVIVNNFLQAHHYHTNPWFSQQWQVNNLYINALTHTMTFTFYDAGTGDSSYVQNWAIPQTDWNYLLK